MDVRVGLQRKLSTEVWCFWTVVLKTLESSLDCKDIQPVYANGNQSWIFIGRTDVETETPILWPPDGKNWLICKDPDAGKDWRQEEKGTTEDEVAGWHHQLYGSEFEWTLGVGDGQGGLACCSPWGCKESEMTKQLNWYFTKAEVQGSPIIRGRTWIKPSQSGSRPVTAAFWWQLLFRSQPELSIEAKIHKQESNET